MRFFLEEFPDSGLASVARLKLRKLDRALVKKSLQGVLYRSRNGGWTVNEEKNTDRKYVGEIKNGRPNGQRTVTRNDGKTYVGEFRKGRLNGQGTVTWPDGRKNAGEWKNGKEWNVKRYDAQ